MNFLKIGKVQSDLQNILQQNLFNLFQNNTGINNKIIKLNELFYEVEKQKVVMLNSI